MWSTRGSLSRRIQRLETQTTDPSASRTIPRADALRWDPTARVSGEGGSRLAPCRSRKTSAATSTATWVEVTATRPDPRVRVEDFPNKGLSSECVSLSPACMNGDSTVYGRCDMNYGARDMSNQGCGGEGNERRYCNSMETDEVRYLQRKIKYGRYCLQFFFYNRCLHPREFLYIQ